MKLAVVVPLCALIATVARAAPAKTSIHIDETVLNHLATALKPVASTLDAIDVATLDLKYSDGKNVDQSLAILKANVSLAVKMIGVVKKRDLLGSVILLSSQLDEIRVGLRDFEQLLVLSGNNSQSAASVRAATPVYQLELPLDQELQTFLLKVLEAADAADATLQDCTQTYPHPEPSTSTPPGVR